MNCLRMNLKFALCVLVLSASGTAFAVDDRLEVLTSEGKVTVGDALGKSSKSVQSKTILSKNNVVTTGPDSRAVVRVGSDGYVVLGNNSKLEINTGSKEKPGFFKQISGIIYYAFNSLKKDRNAIEVKTATTTIGVRGTRFLVTENEERQEIGMRKGVVNVTSADGDFEIHKQAEMNEFEAFRKATEEGVAQKEKEFQDYKTKTEQEFVEFKREFSLGADRMASFDGKQVVEQPLSGETKKEMESVEAFAEKWLNKVRD